MGLSKKIILIWLTLLGIFVACLALFPHNEAPVSSYLNRSIQLLLFVISLFIFLKEPNQKAKFIFLNFLVFFSLTTLTFGYEFVGQAFLTGRYEAHFYYQYVNIAIVLFVSIATIYPVIDLLFHEFKVYQKYVSTLAVVLFFWGIWFYPFMQDPLYLYKTEDIKQWKTLSMAVTQTGDLPSTVELANQVRLQSWDNGTAVGDLYPEENLKRIEQLIPYLEGDNWATLLYRPLHKSLIQMNVLLVGCILLFFGYQYKKDPPQGAYIDKIMFLLLLLSSMEILHNWGYIYSVELNSFTELFIVGQFVTLVIYLLIVLFFSLRLKFITSVQGEFYETELSEHPQSISRWRDWLDNLVLAHFFNFKIFNGRLFQDRSAK
jgi:hypothetical protein